MSPPYVTLGSKPVDQWKVTELREELKRRKLTTKGLKEDLVKRLDEAVRAEREAEVEETDNGVSDATQSELPFEQPTTESVVSGKSNDLAVEKVDSKPENEIDDHRGSFGEGKLVETDLVQATGPEGEQIDQFSAVETTVVVTETVETSETVTVLSESQLQTDEKTEDGNSTAANDGLESSQEDTKLELSDPSAQLAQVNESSTQDEAINSTVELENDDSKSLLPDHNVQPSKYQVSEVDPDLGSQVISDSVSTEPVPIIEKNELKVDVIADDVKIELDVKHEVAQTSLVPDDGESHPMDVEEPLDKKVLTEETGGSHAENVDSLKNIDTGDLGPAEKLNLDRSSGDDSMDEDISETKHVDSSNSDQIGDNVENAEKPIVKEDIDVDVVGLDKPVQTKVANAEKETLPEPTSVKRKFHDKEAVGNNDTVKRPRRWNTEGLKGGEPQSGNVVASTTPKDLPEPIFKRLSGTDSTVNEESPKERQVPPSSKPSTNSLRIDRFLRPFTLKAVQELLGKTGTVNSFWMDQIKTHCYVSYSSVEEAVETRNAVYNLQWPPNGGRLLVAEFVDPQEVKTRVEGGPPLASPTAQPSPRLRVPPPSSLPPPPPPPLSNPPPLPVRDRLNLPPPPPLVEKVDPPIVTLDDLFKKTKAIPRIYYLPLSDEQVAAKLKAQGKNVVNDQ